VNGTGAAMAPHGTTALSDYALALAFATVLLVLFLPELARR